MNGVEGREGATLTGIFATKVLTKFGDNGLRFSNPMQLWVRIGEIAVVWVSGAIGTFRRLKVFAFFAELGLCGIGSEARSSTSGLDLA